MKFWYCLNIKKPKKNYLEKMYQVTGAQYYQPKEGLTP